MKNSNLMIGIVAVAVILAVVFIVAFWPNNDAPSSEGETVLTVAPVSTTASGTAGTVPDAAATTNTETAGEESGTAQEQPTLTEPAVASTAPRATGTREHRTAAPTAPTTASNELPILPADTTAEETPTETEPDPSSTGEEIPTPTETEAVLPTATQASEAEQTEPTAPPETATTTGLLGPNELPIQH